MRFIYSISIILVISGCAVPRIVNRNNCHAITYNNISQMDGVYENHDSLNLTQLWNELKPFFKIDTNSSNRKSKILLKVDNSKFLTFTLIKGNDTLSTKRIRFQIIDGHVVSDDNWQIQGIPLLLYRFAQNALSLSLDANSNLILDSNSNGNGGIFIVIFGYPVTHYTYVFKKVK
jgi:hypothetical protein